MKTLTIEIPDNKTERIVKDLLAKHGIGIVKGLGKVKTSAKNSISKAEKNYEDKVDKNLHKLMMKMTPDQKKTVSIDSVMKILKHK